MLKKLLLVLLAALSISAAGLVMAPAGADIKLPSYAAGADVSTKLESTGKKVTDTVALAVAIICILGLFISGGFLGSGNKERAGQFFWGSIGGLVIAGLAYGIAALVA